MTFISTRSPGAADRSAAWFVPAKISNQAYAPSADLRGIFVRIHRIIVRFSQIFTFFFLEGLNDLTPNWTTIYKPKKDQTKIKSEAISQKNVDLHLENY